MVEIINDSVCRGVAGKRTGKVKGVVPHNTWDNQTVAYHKNRLKNMTTDQLGKGFAHYFIDAAAIGRFEDTYNGAWHVADYDGNMNYIGYEIIGDRATSKEDFLQAEQNACWQMAQDLKYYGLPVNRNTVKLHHEFSSTECPKRSLIEHCGYDSTYVVPIAVTNKLKDYFIKEILKYYNNPNLKPDAPIVKPAVKPVVYQTTPGLYEALRDDTFYIDVNLTKPSAWKIKKGQRLFLEDIEKVGKYTRARVRLNNDVRYITMRDDFWKFIYATKAKKIK